MRTRLRKVPGTPSGKLYFYQGSPENRTAEYPIESRTISYERIDDVNNRRARPNGSYCHHVSSNLNQVPVSVNSYATHSPYGVGCESAFPLCDASRIEELFELPDMGELRYQANERVVSAYASVAKQWSAANDLLELGEIPGLLKQGRAMRNGYLTVEFGWKPVLRWMESLMAALKTYKTRIKTMRDMNGQERRFNFRLSPRKFVPKDDRIYPGSFPYVLWDLTEFRVVPRATGYVTVSCPVLDDALDNLAVMLDVFGVHPDILTAYDATRFTWLLDWFLPLGDYLEQFTDRRWIKPEIKASSGSISYTISGRVRLYTKGYGNYPAFQKTSVGDGRFKIYHRESFSPSTDLLLYASGQPPMPRMPRLNAEQMLLAWGLLDPSISKKR